MRLSDSLCIAEELNVYHEMRSNFPSGNLLADYHTMKDCVNYLHRAMPEMQRKIASDEYGYRATAHLYFLVFNCERKCKFLFKQLTNTKSAAVVTHQLKAA